MGPNDVELEERPARHSTSRPELALHVRRMSFGYRIPLPLAYTMG